MLTTPNPLITGLQIKKKSPYHNYVLCEMHPVCPPAVLLYKYIKHIHSLFYRSVDTLAHRNVVAFTVLAVQANIHCQYNFTIKEGSALYSSHTGQCCPISK